MRTDSIGRGASLETYEASIEDLGFLQRLEQASFARHRQATRKSLKNSVLSPHQKVFIAVGDGEKCGSIVLMPHKRRMRIYSLAVLESHSHQGIGTKLIDRAVKVARQMGIGVLTLEADTHNTKLVHWYEKHGFETIAVLVDFYASGEDAFRMTLDLKKQESTRNIVVTDFHTDFFDGIPDIITIQASQYIDDENYQKIKNVRIFNVCSSLNYQTVGYYVSLLALARNHAVYPNATSLRDFKNAVVIRSIGDEVFNQIQETLQDEPGKSLTIESIFGYCKETRFSHLVKSLNTLYEAPLLSFSFIKEQVWELNMVTTLDLNERHDLAVFKKYAMTYFSQKRFIRSSLNCYDYDLAILVDDQEPNPPSNRIALGKFRSAAESMGFHVEMIKKSDYLRIPEFDALFIRATTNVNEYTYDFARYAYSEGLIVIDDPWSILRCSNKLYLFEALRAAEVRIPQTWPLSQKSDFESKLKKVRYPLILKQPDSAFSLGVHKVEDEVECRAKLKELHKTSEIVIAQEYLPSSFDWRIGILDQKPFFACKYYMAKNHWQIYNWNSCKPQQVEGKTETLPLEKVPALVLATALRAANKIGSGLYGVDLKEIDGEVYVIEVNDNPNMDHGIEDAVLGDQLYLHVMRSFFDRLEHERETIRIISQ